MKRFSQRGGYNTMAELNVTPLLDLAFVLLIIFVITTPLLEQSIPLNLPTASSTKTQVDPKSVKTLSVNHNGDIYFDKQHVTIGELVPVLLRWKQSDPDAAALLRFDRDLRVQQVVDIFDALQKAGVSRMAIVNTPDEGKR